MAEWPDLSQLSDDDLVDELILSGLSPLEDQREVVLEAVRVRLEPVTRRGFHEEGGGSALEDGFHDWFWTFKRLLGCATSFRSKPRGMPFRTFLKRLAKWRALDYFDIVNRQACESLSEDPPARDVGPAAEQEERELLAAIAAEVDALGATYRVPFKLYHVRVFELTERDWPEVLRTADQRRDAIEAALAEFVRGPRATLALKEVAELMGRRLHTIGHYVMLAKDAVVERVARKMGGGREP